MVAAVAAGGGVHAASAAGAASHPAVAVWLGVATAALAGVVVAMAWSVNTRQIRLAEQLARRQLLVTAEPAAAPAARVAAGPAGAGGVLDEGGREGAARAGERAGAIEAARRAGTAEAAGRAGTAEAAGAAGRARPRPARGRQAPPAVIEGPDSLVAGEQARYRVPQSGTPQVVSWAVGGGPVSHAPDPAHPDELLLIAEQPGELTVTVRVREGLTERRDMKSVTVAPDLTASTPPLTMRLFLNGWGLVVVAVLIVGFAGALDALGTFTSSDFIALAVPLAALLGVISVARGHGDAGGRPAHGKRPL